MHSMRTMQCTYLILLCEMANVLDSPCKDGGHILPLRWWDDGPQGAHAKSDSVPVSLQEYKVNKVACNDKVISFAPLKSHAHYDTSSAQNEQVRREYDIASHAVDSIPYKQDHLLITHIRMLAHSIAHAMCPTRRMPLHTV